jgi:hypothetical protein
MNYEVDQYIEAGQKLPQRDAILISEEGDHYFFKADVLSGMVTYSTDKRIAANLVTIPAERAMEVLAMNQKGEKPVTLEEGGHKEAERPVDLATQDDLNRFDKKKKKKKKKKSHHHNDGEAKTESPTTENEHQDA